jgi:hypothetical protein
MAEVYTLGLAKIEIGAIAADGGMGTTLTVWGQTLQGTCNVTQDDPETTDFYAEEVDDPVVSISKRGKTTVVFSVMNPDVAALEKFFGGSVDSQVTPPTWKAPANLPAIEKSLKITPQIGLIWEFPRVKITAKLNGQFSRENIFVIEVSGAVLQPEKSGEPPYSAYPITSA